MIRSLKSQIQADAKRVFLDLEGFAVMTEITYWRHGTGKPPEIKRLKIVVDEDEYMNSVWNKNKNQQRIGNDQVAYQMEKVLFVAREDFSPPPKKGRRLQLDGDAAIWEVLSVGTEGGLLKIEMRELEE